MAITSNKQIPTQVLDALQQFYTKESTLFKRVKSDGQFLIRFVDSDSKSDFFFEVTSFNVDTENSITFWINRAPQSQFSVAPAKLNITSQIVDTHFNMWVEQLALFLKIKGPIEEDLILKQYEEEFFTEVELIDGDADTVSYDYKTQLLLDLYLDKVVQLLDEAKNNSNATEIDDVKTDVVELKNNQTRFTKKVVVQHLCKIWAKVRKIGLPLLTLVKDEALKELIKEGVKFLIGG